MARGTKLIHYVADQFDEDHHLDGSHARTGHPGSHPARLSMECTAPIRIMWTAPGLQEIGGRAKRIACDHMSGLLWRPHMAAGQDGFHKASPKHTRDVLAPLDPTECHASWTDRSHHLLRLKQASGPPRSGDTVPVNFNARAALVLTAGRHGAMRAHGTRSEALSKRSAAARRCGGHMARIIAFAADHQLPDPQRTAVASRFYLAVNLRPYIRRRFVPAVVMSRCGGSRSKQRTWQYRRK
jgi:hypothetical protein